MSSQPDAPDFETPEPSGTGSGTDSGTDSGWDPSWGPAWPSPQWQAVPALRHLAAVFHDALLALPHPWSAGVLTVGLFASSAGSTLEVVPRAHLMTRLPTGDQSFDLLVWDEFAPEAVLDPAIEECGWVEAASLLFIHVHSPIAQGAGAQIRLRVGAVDRATRAHLDDPVWLARLVRNPETVFA